LKSQITEQDLLQTGNLEFLAKQVVEGFITGLHKSPFHGFSVEFAEHRQYNTGESIKHIDWKLFARTEKLYTKRFEEETNLRCHIIIDRSSSMYFPEEGFNKIRFSVYAAASLIYLMKKQRDAVALSVFSDEVEFVSQAKSSMVHAKMLFNKLEQILASQQKNVNSNISKALHQIAETIHQRSLVIVFSDFMQSGNDDLHAALQHLKYNKHEVILFDVKDKNAELLFDFKNRPYQFIDSESGEKLKLHPNAVKDNYLKALEEYEAQLKLKCTQYHIELVKASLSNNFTQILLPFLMKRNKIK
jgi:uncharacterized protein (DUF58 family)